MSASTCLHCNARLSYKARAEGWCDSCGKRMPASVARGRGGRSAILARMTPAGTIAVVAFALVFGLLGAVAAAGASGGQSWRLGVPAGAVVGAVLARTILVSRRPDPA